MSPAILKLASSLLTESDAVGEITVEELDSLQRWGIEGLVHGSETALAASNTWRRAHAMALRSGDERRRIIAVASHAVEALNNNGVDVVAFKGLSTERYYSAPVYRSYGDADLYVPDVHQGDIYAGLQALGLRPAEATDTLALAQSQQLSGFTVFEQGIGLDIHFIPTSQFFQTNPGAADLAGEGHLPSLAEAIAPCPEFDLLIAAVNSVRDSGRSLKAAIDVVVIIHAVPTLDWGRFDHLAKHYQMQAVVRPAIARIGEQLGINLALDRQSAPLARFDLLETARALTLKRSNLLNLYYGPQRGTALLSAARWLLPSASRLSAEGLILGDSRPTTRLELWAERLQRFRTG